MGNATWCEVAAKSNVSANPFSLGMKSNCVSASQAGSAISFLSMMGMLQPVTADKDEEAKEDTIDDTDDEDQDEEIQEGDSYDHSDTFIIPTFQEKPYKQLNTRGLTFEDLETLKEEDPFMYYSIPEVRRAVFEGRDVDLTTASPIVKRRRVISCESADFLDFDHLQAACDEMSDCSDDDIMVMFLSCVEDH